MNFFSLQKLQEGKEISLDFYFSPHLMTVQKSSSTLAKENIHIELYGKSTFIKSTSYKRERNQSSPNSQIKCRRYLEKYYKKLILFMKLRMNYVYLEDKSDKSCISNGEGLESDKFHPLWRKRILVRQYYDFSRKTFLIIF